MKKNFKKSEAPKPVTLINPVNNDIWHCDDYNDIKNIDGVEFIKVYKQDYYKRVFLMKKIALNLVDKRNVKL